MSDRLVDMCQDRIPDLRFSTSDLRTRIGSRQSAIGNRRCAGRILPLAFALALSAAAGCGPSAGAWMYTMGMVPKTRIQAEYPLKTDALLVLVDDEQDLVQPPLARHLLIDALARQLKEHGVAQRVTTNEEIARVRQVEHNFDQRGAREVGQLVQADTVLWLAIRQFSAPHDIELTVAPAQFVVSVKLVNAKAETREDVRLWPMDREGRLVAVSINPHEIRTCRSAQELHEKLADTMASDVAKLFYNQTIEH